MPSNREEVKENSLSLFFISFASFFIEINRFERKTTSSLSSLPFSFFAVSRIPLTLLYSFLDVPFMTEERELRERENTLSL